MPVNQVSWSPVRVRVVPHLAGKPSGPSSGHHVNRLHLIRCEQEATIGAPGLTTRSKDATRGSCSLLDASLDSRTDSLLARWRKTDSPVVPRASPKVRLKMEGTTENTMQDVLLGGWIWNSESCTCLSVS